MDCSRLISFFCRPLWVAVLGGLGVRAERAELFGSVLFSLSLNFKQMALYYAPAFFFHLLASCLRGAAGGKASGKRSFALLHGAYSLRIPRGTHSGAKPEALLTAFVNRSEAKHE